MPRFNMYKKNNLCKDRKIMTFFCAVFGLTNWAGLAAFRIRYFTRHCVFPEDKIDDSVFNWHEQMWLSFMRNFSNQTRARERERDRKWNTARVQFYLGNSLWVGKATILWSFRACSYNSFSEWEWSCNDLPVNTASDAVWKLVRFDSCCWVSEGITGWWLQWHR